MVEVGSESKLPGLDALRAIAVLSVMLFHQAVFPAGWIGVQVFFVLSGYLITRSLFRTRSAPLRSYLVSFYGRRSLRILPLYYAVLALLALAALAGKKLPGVREGLPYAATYTYNFFHATARFQHSDFITHFWSLCVEEQFYLCWPFVLYFCPQKRLKPLIVGTVLAGPLLRLITFWGLSAAGAHASPQTHIALYVLTPSHVDAFATGAYLSLFPLGGAPRVTIGALLLTLAAGLCIVLFGADQRVGTEGPLSLSTLGYPLGISAAYGFIWGYTLLNLTSGLVIDCLVNRKLAPRFFDLPVLRHIGKISYGFYVIHYPMQSVVPKLIHGALWRQILVQMVGTTVLATASFKWESKLLGLKDRWFKIPSALSMPEARPTETLRPIAIPRPRARAFSSSVE